MSSRMLKGRKKRPLPPWLQGVAVKCKKSDDDDKNDDDKKEESNDSDTTTDSRVDSETMSHSAGSVQREKKQDDFSTSTLIAMSYPEYMFPGSMIYSHNKDDCNILCEDLMSSMDLSQDVFIGFDTEWPVTYKIGKQAKTALVQICINESKCYLFHISCMTQFPVMLKKLIEHDRIKKVGLNVEYDLWKLEADFDIQAKPTIQRSTIELRTLANLKLKSAENWSLEGLAKNQLQLRISKDPAVRKCDWSQFPLPDEQRAYAATDAAISLMLYQKLMSKPG